MTNITILSRAPHCCVALTIFEPYKGNQQMENKIRPFSPSCHRISISSPH